MRCLKINPAFSRNHQIGLVQWLVNLQVLHDNLKTRVQSCTQEGVQSHARAAGRAAVDFAYAGYPLAEALQDGEMLAEAEDAAREAIDVLGPDGGLILGPGCALGHTTPPENIHALIKTAWKYGVYNPDGTLRAV